MKQVPKVFSPFVRSDYLKLFMLVKKLIIRPIVVAQVLEGPWFESCIKLGINFLFFPSKIISKLSTTYWHVNIALKSN